MSARLATSRRRSWGEIGNIRNANSTASRPSAYVIPARRQALSAVAPVFTPAVPAVAAAPIAPVAPITPASIIPRASTIIPPPGIPYPLASVPQIERPLPSPKASARYPTPYTQTIGGKKVISIPHPFNMTDAYHLDISAFNSNDQFNLGRHCEQGRWIDPRDFEFGDVVNMCISHDIFGPALRYYQFYKTVTIAGRQCPLFLCQITNGKQGPFNGDREFFQTSISFLLEDRPERKVFVNAAHIVAIVPPEHGLIFAQLQRDRKGSPAECARLREDLDHLADAHPGLLRRLCTHLTCSHGSSPGTDVAQSTKDIKMFLQLGREAKCSKKGCRVCETVVRLADVSLQRRSKPWTGRRGGDNGKIHPPEDLCVFATGQGLHYSPDMGSWMNGI